MVSNLREENARKAARRRFEARELLNRLKSGPCVDCGVRYKSCQMDLVRRNGSTKLPMSQLLLRSQTTIVKDANECDLLCANCGRLRIWKRQRARRSGPV